SSTEIDVPKADVKPAELKLAQQLIDSQTSDKFDPTAYKDELRARIEASIQKKVEGAEISVSELAPAGESKVIDLMEALRASLEKTETARTSASQLGPRKAPKRVEQPAPAKAEQPAKPARKATKRSRQFSKKVQRPAYSVHDVERVLPLSRSAIRGLVAAGFVTPERGARREYRFSFRDLI